MKPSDYEAVPISIISFRHIPQSSPAGCAVYKFCVFSSGQNREICRRSFERQVNILQSFTATKLLFRCPSAFKTGGGGGFLYELRGFGARLRCICFCLSRYYHNLSVLQISLFRPSPSSSVDQSFRFSVNIFSPSAFARGPDFFFFLTRVRTHSRLRCCILQSLLTFLSYYCYRYTVSSLSGQLENATDIESS